MTIVLDRLIAGEQSAERLRDSIESAFAAGGGACVVLAGSMSRGRRSAKPQASGTDRWSTLASHGVQHCAALRRMRHRLSGAGAAAIQFQSAVGSLPRMRGLRQHRGDRHGPRRPGPEQDRFATARSPRGTRRRMHTNWKSCSRSPTTTSLPVDVPFAQLTEEQRRLIIEGVPERNFGGLNGFFRWLERRKYKMHLRVFLSRWRKYLPCPACGGARLRPEALAVRVGGKNFADVCGLKIRDALAFFDELQLPEWQQQVAQPLVKDVRSRLTYLRRRRPRLSGARPTAAHAQRRRSAARRTHRDAWLQPRRHAVRAG